MPRDICRPSELPIERTTLLIMASITPCRLLRRLLPAQFGVEPRQEEGADTIRGIACSAGSVWVSGGGQPLASPRLGAKATTAPRRSIRPVSGRAQFDSEWWLHEAPSSRSKDDETFNLGTRVQVPPP